MGLAPDKDARVLNVLFELFDTILTEREAGAD